MKFKHFSILFLLVFISATPSERTYIYVSELTENPTTRSLTLRISGNELLAELKAPGMEETMYMTEDHRLNRWIMVNSSGTTNIRGERQGNEIILTGTKKGKSYDKTHEIDENPWYQAWEIGLETFILSSENEMKFWSVNPGMLKVGLFTAVKSGIENIEVNGVSESAERVDITMKGLGPRLFRCEFWFRPDTGVMLRSKFKIFGSKSGEYLKELR